MQSEARILLWIWAPAQEHTALRVEHVRPVKEANATTRDSHGRRRRHSCVVTRLAARSRRKDHESNNCKLCIHRTPAIHGP